jgi:hypothetical protein
MRVPRPPPAASRFQFFPPRSLCSPFRSNKKGVAFKPKGAEVMWRVLCEAEELSVGLCIAPLQGGSSEGKTDAAQELVAIEIKSLA